MATNTYRKFIRMFLEPARPNRIIRKKKILRLYNMYVRHINESEKQIDSTAVLSREIRLAIQTVQMQGNHYLGLKLKNMELLEKMYEML